MKHSADLLTEEIIEAGAAAIWDRPAGQYATRLDQCRLNSRACLSAALPGILEACAMAIEEHRNDYDIRNPGLSFAAHIRALIPKG